MRTGSTYTEYLELMRMRRAAELLKSTDKSINYVALALGYETPNTFYKAFKRVYHVSPGVYRTGPQGESAPGEQVDEAVLLWKNRTCRDNHAKSMP